MVEFGIASNLARNGVRFMLYLGLTVLVPIIAILSLEARITQEMTGAIAAAAVGGVLSGIGKDE